jgi:peptidoglycan/LPS O-acetylase OafA/YrhL
MTRGLSLYLDLVRVVAAFMVPLCHFGLARNIEPSLAVFAPFEFWGHQAVVVFFVLSGFVISHAVASRDVTFQSYGASRLSRIYSVVVPCLALTILFDQVGQHVARGIYTIDGAQDNPLTRIVVCLTMLNQSWRHVGMFSNVSFWSMCCEFWFYMLFAVGWFSHGRRRVIYGVIVGGLAGPVILLLMPIWLMGVLAQREQLSARWSKLCLWIALVQPLLIAGTCWYVDLTALSVVWTGGLTATIGVTPGAADMIINDYPVGLSVALHLVAAKRLMIAVPRLARFETLIRALAARSFTLYLLHIPTMLVCGALTEGYFAGWSRALLIIAPTIGLPLLLAPWIEGQRHRLRPMFERLIGRIAKPDGRVPALSGA